MPKRSREELDCDIWFRAQVQQAIDDPRPSIPHEAVMREVLDIIECLAAKKPKA